MSSRLSSSVLSGVAWLTIGRIASFFAQLMITIILVRLLLPEDFGIFAIAMAIVGIGDTITNSGFGEALIEKQDASETDIQSVFWLTVLIAITILVCLNLIAPLLASYYDLSDLEIVVRFLSIPFLLGAIKSVPHILLLKSLKVQSITIITLGAKFIYAIVTILLALAGYGIWSLVVGVIFHSSFEVISIFIICKWRPRLVLSFQSIRSLSGFTFGFFAFKLISNVSRNLDTFILGNTLGATALGLYNRAYGIMVLPASSVGNLLTQVMFPALSLLKGDSERTRRAYLRSVRLLIFIIAPVMLGIVAVADPLVKVVFGEQWVGMTIALQILAPVGITQSLVGTTYWIFMSQGHTVRMLRWELFNLFGVVLALFVGITIGNIEAVAGAYLVVNVILLFVSIKIAGDLIDLQVSKFVSQLGSTILVSGIMCLFVMWLVHFPLTSLLSWQKLALGVSVGIISYSSMMLLQRTSPAYEFVRIIIEKLLLIRVDNSNKSPKHNNENLYSGDI